MESPLSIHGVDGPTRTRAAPRFADASPRFVVRIVDAMGHSRRLGGSLLGAMRLSSSRARLTASTATALSMRATRATHLDADPRSSFAVAAVRGITTKSPLEAELEQQRAVEEMERAQAEMREEAAG